MMAQIQDHCEFSHPTLFQRANKKGERDQGTDNTSRLLGEKLHLEINLNCSTDTLIRLFKPQGTKNQ